MTDIVERLRIGRETCGVDMCRIREAKSGCTCAEAADEIERLRKREEILSGWLNGALDVVERFTVADTKNARTALGEKE